MRINTKITPRWVTPEHGEGARFRLRPMNGQDRLELALQIEERGNRVVYPAAAQVQTVHACLTEWDVEDEDGRIAPLTLENVRQLDELVLLELFGELSSGSRLHDDAPAPEGEAGN